MTFVVNNPQCFNCGLQECSCGGRQAKPAATTTANQVDEDDVLVPPSLIETEAKDRRKAKEEPVNNDDPYAGQSTQDLLPLPSTLGQPRHNG